MKNEVRAPLARDSTSDPGMVMVAAGEFSSCTHSQLGLSRVYWGYITVTTMEMGNIPLL